MNYLIKNPTETSSPFIITMKSKEEIIQKKKISAVLSLTSTILLFIGFVMIFIVGIINSKKCINDELFK